MQQLSVLPREVLGLQFLVGGQLQPGVRGKLVGRGGNGGFLAAPCGVTEPELCEYGSGRLVPGTFAVSSLVQGLPCRGLQQHLWVRSTQEQGAGTPCKKMKDEVLLSM